jgi:hypothetical protein
MRRELCRRGRNPLAGARVEVAETDLGRGPLSWLYRSRFGRYHKSATIDHHPETYYRRTVNSFGCRNAETRICRLFPFAHYLSSEPEIFCAGKATIWRVESRLSPALSYSQTAVRSVP